MLEQMDRYGLRLTVKLGKSYEEKLIDDLLLKIKTIEQELLLVK